MARYQFSYFKVSPEIIQQDFDLEALLRDSSEMLTARKSVAKPNGDKRDAALLEWRQLLAA